MEGAHIIPVREEGSSDEVWNGIALCPNHHELFDGSAFVVGGDLRVRVDDSRVEYLEENGLAQGIEILTDYRNESIRQPYFWERDAALREHYDDSGVQTISTLLQQKWMRDRLGVALTLVGEPSYGATGTRQPIPMRPGRASRALKPVPCVAVRLSVR